MTDDIERAAQELAGVIHRLRAETRALAGASQAAYRSVELSDGPVSYFDEGGTERLQVGAQGDDGAFTITELNSPAPPKPSSPTLEPVPGGIKVTWDGTFEDANIPIDFDHLEIHASEVPDYIKDDTTQIGSFISVNGGVYLWPDESTDEVYFAFVVVNRAGVESEPSDEEGAAALGILPPSSDGSVPPKVLGLVADGGIRTVFLNWQAVVNPDPVMYKVYASMQNPVVRDAAHFLEKTSSPRAVVNKAYDSVSGGMVTAQAGVPIYTQVVANDLDGDGVASDQAVGTPVQINSPDIATNAVIAEKILASSITADKFSAILVMVSKILLGARITQSDLDGIEIRADVGVTKFPTDNSAASIAADMIAFSLEVRDSLNVRGPNNYLSGTQTAASGIIDPKTPASLSNFWPSKVIPVGMPNFKSNSVAMTRGSNPMGKDIALVSYDYDDGINFGHRVEIWRDNGDNTETLIKSLWDSGVGGYINIGGAAYNLIQGMGNIVAIDDGAGHYNYLVGPVYNLATDPWQFRVLKYDWQFNFVSSFVVTPVGAYDTPSMVLGGGNNATDIVIAWQRAADDKISTRTYNHTTGAAGAVVTTPSAYPGYPKFIDGQIVGGLGGGTATGYAMRLSDGKWYKVSAAMARIIAEEMPMPPVVNGVFAVGIGDALTTSYKILDGIGNLWTHANSWVARPFRGRYTWYDGDPLGTYGAGGETLASPYKEFSVAPGAYCRIDVSAPPDGGDPDDPDRVRFYMNTDQSAVYKLQGAGTVGQLSTYFTSLAAGANVPAVSGFAGRPGAVGIHQAAASDALGKLWYHRGDGPGRAGPLVWDIDGYQSQGVRGTASFFRVAAQNILDSTNTLLIKDTDEWTMDPTLFEIIGGQLRLKKAGLYYASANCQWAANSTGRRRFNIRKNSAAVANAGTIIDHWESSGAIVGSAAAITARVGRSFQGAVGDYILPQVFQDSGTASPGLAVLANSYRFQIEKRG